MILTRSRRAEPAGGFLDVPRPGQPAALVGGRILSFLSGRAADPD